MTASKGSQKRPARHYRTSLSRGNWRLTEAELENVWSAARIVWAAQGLTGGTECYYALARLIEDTLMDKWQQR